MVLTVRLLPKYCSCMNMLGSRQHEYEDLLTTLVAAESVRRETLAVQPTNSPLDAVRKAALDEMNWIRICCRTTALTCAQYFVKDATKDAFIDELGKSKVSQKMGGLNPHLHPGETITLNAPGVVPRHPRPEYPPLPGVAAPSTPRKAERERPVVPAFLAPLYQPSQSISIQARGGSVIRVLGAAPSP